MERISVYIDGANFFGGLRTINSKYTDFKFDFYKYINHITSNKKLVSVKYYNASLKQNINPDLFKNQQKFFERLRNYKHYTVILCKRQSRNGPDGEYFSIKGDYIHLAIDMLNDAWENKFDKAILISGDGDFSPLVKYVKKKSKKVESHHFKENISLDLAKNCDSNIIIDKKIVNKFFYREEYTLGDTDKGKKTLRKIKNLK
ncbi:MAG: NYN domain-containing protein [Candidatus Woesearchaeota archaeon]